MIDCAMRGVATMPPAGTPVDYRPFLIPWFVTVGGLLLVATASIVYRVRTGRYVFRPHLTNAVFSETWASGRSHRDWITRLGAASGCLWVAVTPDELLVGPHFPFNLMFMPEMYGLEYRASGADIESVELSRSLFGRQKAVIQLRTKDGGRESFELALRDVAEFAAAVERLKGPAEQPS